MIIIITMRNSIQDLLRRSINEKEKGSLVFPQDFKGLGTPLAVNMAFSRLCKEGIIIRLAHGIYMIPKKDDLLGTLYPGMEDIAKAIAERDRVRIRPAGSFALHKLGLTTQVPMNLVYLTDGTPRKIKIGKGSIRFIKTTPKKLLLKGTISALVIQALEELGQKEVTPYMQQQLKEILKNETAENIAHDFKLTTAWICKLLIEPSQLRIIS